MIAWFCNWQFTPYKHAFQPYGDAGSLDKTEVAYTYLYLSIYLSISIYSSIYLASCI